MLLVNTMASQVTHATMHCQSTPLLTVAPALKVLAAEGVGLLAGAIVARCVLGCYTLAPSSLHEHLPLQQRMDMEFNKMHRKNSKRLKYRSSAKLAGVAYLLNKMPSEMPSLIEMIVYCLWNVFDALMDELQDLPTEWKNGRYNLVLSVVAAGLLIPIPVLLFSSPALYASYAAYLLTKNMLAGKIDNTVFKITAVLGWASVFFATNGLSGFPIEGMLILLFSSVIYESHDEYPSLSALAVALGYSRKPAERNYIICRWWR